MSNNSTITIESNTLLTLANAYYRGIGQSPNYRKAIQYYEKAAQSGVPHAYCMLGICYEDGLGVDQDILLAKSYYESGCDQDDILSFVHLGDLYWHGKSPIPTDRSIAASLYQEALELLQVVDDIHHTAEVLSRIGDCLLLGIGLPKDIQQAANYYAGAIQGFWFRIDMGESSCEVDLTVAEKKHEHCMKLLHKK